MFKGMGQMGDMAKMMKSAQELQQKMEQLQEEMHEIMVTGESGAGLVKATASAKGDLKGLDIDPSIFNGDDKEVVEDLILAAIKDAQSKASDRAAEEMQKIQEELGLPAGMKLPFYADPRRDPTRRDTTGIPTAFPRPPAQENRLT